MGASLAVVTLVGLLSQNPIFSALLVLSGVTSNQFGSFFKQIPSGTVILKIVDVADAILP